MDNDDIDIRELFKKSLTPEFQAEILVRGSRRVVSKLIESVMLDHSWDFNKAGGDRDLEIVLQLGKQLRDRPLRLDGGISLLSLGSKKTLVQFYSGPRSFEEFVLSDSNYQADVDFVREVKDAIIDRLIQLGLLKASEERASETPC